MEKMQSSKSKKAPDCSGNGMKFFFAFDCIPCLWFVANKCRRLACFGKGDEGTGEMMTVLFIIILVMLNNTLDCPR